MRNVAHCTASWPQMISAPPASMRPGQTMDVKLQLGDTQEALVVPNGPWLRENGGSAIFVMNDAEHADLRPVTVGRRNPDSVEILGGLTAGERVVTASRLDQHSDARHLLIKKGKPQ